eukprot:TRINITY_DN30304_c0_g1_i1.p1 TRINITY_DN30304_c0_g1~~TRINITY_DN30304_c0_g1_i1.p1  ORF type:complete len:188 (+),score=16.38 TRINITY_DN30304_c0_g1_i1:75-638(+)
MLTARTRVRLSNKSGMIMHEHPSGKVTVLLDEGGRVKVEREVLETEEKVVLGEFQNTIVSVAEKSIDTPKLKEEEVHYQVLPSADNVNVSHLQKLEEKVQSLQKVMTTPPPKARISPAAPVPKVAPVFTPPRPRRNFNSNIQKLHEMGEALNNLKQPICSSNPEMGWDISSDETSLPEMPMVPHDEW